MERMKRRVEHRTSRQPQAAQSERGLRQQPTAHFEEAVSIATPARTDEAHLYGVAPVLEALRAGQRTIERITIADGARHNRLRELIEIARRAGVPVHYAPRADLARIVGASATHQGVVATVAAA